MGGAPLAVLSVTGHALVVTYYPGIGYMGYWSQFQINFHVVALRFSYSGVP